MREDKNSSTPNNKNAPAVNGQESSNDSDNKDEEVIDRKPINCSVRDAGKYSDGVFAVELWTLSSDGRELVRLDGG